MNNVFANYAVSISELKNNPTALLKKANGQTIAVLNHNRPTAYLVPATLYEALLDKLDDEILKEIVARRKVDIKNAIDVDLDEI